MTCDHGRLQDRSGSASLMQVFGETAEELFSVVDVGVELGRNVRVM